MQFTDLYDKLAQWEKVFIVDENRAKTYYQGDLGRLPHSVYEKICLYEVLNIHTYEREDDYSYETYLVVEVID